MRARTGCQACRERHIKCVRENATDKCQKCMENNRACYQTARHRFRPVTSVNLKTDDERTVKQNLTYDSNQKWVNIPTHVEFVDDNKDESAQGSGPASKVARTGPGPRASDLLKQREQELPFRETQSDDGFDYCLGQQETDSVLDDLAINLPPVRLSPEQAIAALNHVSPSQISGWNKRNTMRSPGLTSLTSPRMGLQPQWPVTTELEARYLHHYINDVAPWVDALDALSHWGKEVPRRAPFYPVIANAIFALSSRHIAMTTDGDDSESRIYASKCAEMLISSLDDPFAHWDENLLAAVVLCRLHEELSHEDDHKAHLFGTRRILDSISAFAADGGLRESASWVSLRQHVYISLVQQVPLDIDLQNFRHSSVFQEGTMLNEDWGNRIVFLFAEVLEYTLGSSSRSDKDNNHNRRPERWHELKAAVERWNETKPWDWEPLWYDMHPESKVMPATPASVGMATTPKETPPWPHHRSRSMSNSVSGQNANTYLLKPWPDIIIGHRAQTTGLQYYHLSRVVLAIYDPALTRLGFGSYRARKASEKTVVDGLRYIVGLSASNENCHNSLFEAHHILKVCGGYLRDPAEQNAAVAYLERITRRMGWKTAKTIGELRAQWAADL